MYSSPNIVHSNQIIKNKKVGSCSMHNVYEKCIQNFSLETSNEETILIRILLQGDKIKVELKEVGCENANWIKMAVEPIMGLVNMVISL